MSEPFSHEALPYAGHAEFVSCCVSLISDGLESGLRPLLLAEEAKLSDVRDALGVAAADDVAFVPTDEHGRNPNRLTTLLHSFQSAADGQRSLGINEPMHPGRSPSAVAETQFGETVLNTSALRSWPLDVVCLYDSTALDGDVLDGMRRTHPVVRGEPPNGTYDPELAMALFRTHPPPAPACAQGMTVGDHDLGALRAFIRDFAGRQGLAPDRVADLVLAANEVVTNSLRYGGGTCRLRVWRDGPGVVCEFADKGHITDPLVGRLAPAPTASSGRGLWLANHLCDLVQIRSSPAGTVVRLSVERL